MDTLVSGGVLMVPLGLCALLGLAFIIERFLVLGKVPDDSTAQNEFEEAERILLNDGEVAAAPALQQRQRSAKLHLCRTDQTL